MQISTLWKHHSDLTLKWHVNFNIPCLNLASRWIVVSTIMIRQMACSNIEIVLSKITKLRKPLISCNLRPLRAPPRTESTVTTMFLLMPRAWLQLISISCKKPILTSANVRTRETWMFQTFKFQITLFNHLTPARFSTLSSKFISRSFKNRSSRSTLEIVILIKKHDQSQLVMNKICFQF